MKQELTPQKEWNDYINSAIEDLKTKHPTLNLSQIAMKINLNRSTLNRIINEGIKPQLDNYIKIIIGSGNSDLISEALAAYDKSLSSKNENIFKVALSEKNSNFSTAELEEILDSEEMFVTYILANKEIGTTSEEVIHVLGNTGIDSLRKLKALGLITENNGTYTCLNNNVLIRSFESIKRHLPTYAKHYKIEHVGQNRNYVHSLSSGLSTRAIAEAQELHRNFHEQLIKIMRNPENVGENTFFSVAFCDSFNSIEFTPIQRGQLQ